MAHPGAPLPGKIPLDIPKKEEFVELSVCATCGSAVIDTKIHNRYHEREKIVAASVQALLMEDK